MQAIRVLLKIPDGTRADIGAVPYYHMKLTLNKVINETGLDKKDGQIMVGAIGGNGAYTYYINSAFKGSLNVFTALARVYIMLLLRMQNIPTS